MKNLRPGVRHKAIEIANALLAAGRPEGQAIRIAIWSAQRWGAGHAFPRHGARRLGSRQQRSA